MLEHTKRQVKVFFFFPEIRLYFLMFIRSHSGFLFLRKLRWPKTKVSTMYYFSPISEGGSSIRLLKKSTTTTTNKTKTNRKNSPKHPKLSRVVNGCEQVFRSNLLEDWAQILWRVTHDQRASEYCILGFTASNPGYIISKMADEGLVL